MQQSQGAAAPSLPAPSTLDLVVLDDEALSQVAGSAALVGPGSNWSDMCVGPGGNW